MYVPKYTITDSILVNIGQIEGAKELIANAPLVPSYEKQFLTDAVVRTVHHGTHIEGNELTLSQTKRIIEGQEVYGRPRDIQEVINYRNVMGLIDDLSYKRGSYDIETLKEIHRATVINIVSNEKIGVLRRTQVVLKDEATGEVVFAPPPYIEVPYLLEDFFEWLNSSQGKVVHPILRAAMTHYILVAIHPFVEGNGRVVRAFTNLILRREEYDIKRFFSLEEHFDSDLAGYYEAFSKVDKQSENIGERDLTPWLEYFSEVVAVELNKIKEKVKKISVDTKLKLKMGEQVALSERQIRIFEYLGDVGYATMQDLTRILPMVSEDTILRDIAYLKGKGIIKKEGSTKAARYVIVK